LAIDPDDIHALTGKGISLYYLGNYTGAISYYDKVLAIKPNDTKAIEAKAAAIDKLGSHNGT